MNEHAIGLYVECFARRAPELGLRAESPADEAFLLDLAAACSPLAGFLPPPIIAQQARFQLDGHRALHPFASGWIALDGDKPVGRVSIDWDVQGNSHCVDCAVMPESREKGIGRALLGAWLDVADTLGLPATLEVRRGNRALELYLKMGFAIDPGCDPAGPVIDMTRRPLIG